MNWTEIGLTHYMVLAALLFSIGLLGVLTQRHIIRVLMGVELMLNAVNINLVAMNNFVRPEELAGQVFAIFVLTISAAEAAVGLAIVIALYRRMATVDTEQFSLLKW